MHSYNEASATAKYIGTAYDVVKCVHDNLADISQAAVPIRQAADFLFFHYTAVQDQTVVTGADLTGRALVVSVSADPVVFVNDVQVAAELVAVENDGTQLRFTDPLNQGDQVKIAPWGLNPDGTIYYGDLFSDAVMEQLLADTRAAVGYDSRADLLAATVDADIPFVRLRGYAQPGDGGDQILTRVEVEPTHGLKAQSADGAWWEFTGSSVRAEQAGMKADGLSASAATNATGMADALAYLQEKGGGRLELANGRYRLNAATVIPASGIQITGPGRQVCFLDYADAVGTHGIEIEGNISYLVLEGFQVQNADLDGVSIRKSGTSNPSRSTLRNIAAKFCGGDGFDFAGAFLYQLQGLHSQQNGGRGFDFNGYHTTISASDCQAISNTGDGWSLFDMTYSHFEACASDKNGGDAWRIEQFRGVLNGCGCESNTGSGIRAIGSVGAITTGVHAVIDGFFAYNNDAAGAGANALIVDASAAEVSLSLRQSTDLQAVGGISVAISGSNAETFVEGCKWVGSVSAEGVYRAPFKVGTKALLEATEIDPGVNVVEVDGYYAPGDGGGGRYQKVDADPGHALKIVDASGQIFELMPEGGQVSVLQAGARGDGVTDDHAAFMNAIDAFTGMQAEADQGITIIVPPTKFGYFLGSTIELKKMVRLKGQGFVSPNAQLVFAPNTSGIIVHMDDTIGESGNEVASTQGRWSYIEGLSLYSQSFDTKTSAGTFHGILLRAGATVRDVIVKGFPGSGIAILADVGGGPVAPDGNANRFVLENIKSRYNRDHGIYAEGADANAGSCFSADLEYNGKYGLLDRSFLGNHWYGIHTNGNGNPDRGYNSATQSSRVSYNGNRYQAMPEVTEATLAATTPGTNAAVWDFLEVGGVAGSYIDWNTAVQGDMFEGGPICLGGPAGGPADTNRAWMGGGYAESNQGKACLGDRTAWFGGINATAGIIGTGKRFGGQSWNSGELLFKQKYAGEARNHEIKIRPGADKLIRYVADGDDAQGLVYEWSEAYGGYTVTHGGVPVVVYTSDLDTLGAGAAQVVFMNGLWLGNPASGGRKIDAASLPRFRAQNQKTGTAYTLASTWEGTVHRFTNGGTITVTVPEETGGVSFPADFEVELWLDGTGTINIAQANANVVINGAASAQTSAAWTHIKLKRKDVNNWRVSGVSLVVS